MQDQLFIKKIFLWQKLYPEDWAIDQKFCQQQGYSQLLVKINILILSFLHQFK